MTGQKTVMAVEYLIVDEDVDVDLDSKKGDHWRMRSHFDLNSKFGVVVFHAARFRLRGQCSLLSAIISNSRQEN